MFDRVHCVIHSKRTTTPKMRARECVGGVFRVVGWRGAGKCFGGYSGGETPGLIPNPEAKPFSADGTALGRVWESRTPPDSTWSVGPHPRGETQGVWAYCHFPGLSMSVL